MKARVEFVAVDGFAAMRSDALIEAKSALRRPKDLDAFEELVSIRDRLTGR